MEHRKILVVEDNPLNQKLVKVMLSREPYDLTIADTAEEGLRMARAETPDLILMDIRLPGMDGLEATREIRKDGLLRECLVVAFSAGAMRGDREKALAAGCDYYISKPVKPRLFVERIKLLLEGRTKNAGRPSSLPSAPRVLLVGSERAALTSLQHQLSGDWVLVETSRGGVDAIAKARAWLPEVLLVDIGVDLSDALELLRDLAESTDLASIPCAVLSSDEEESSRVALIEAGAISVVHKPVSNVELRVRFLGMVGARQRARQCALRIDAAGACGAPHRRRSKTLQVLIAEAEPTASRILEFGLRHLGAEVQVASTSVEASRRIARGGIDLIALEVTLPDMDGLEFARKLADSPSTSGIPLLVIAAPTESEVRTRAFEVGVQEFLTMPVNDKELCSHASRLLRQKEVDDELRYLGKDASLRHQEIEAQRSMRTCFFHSTLELGLQSAIALRHPLAVAIVRRSDGDRPPAEWAGALRRHCREIDWFGRLADGSFGVVFANLGIEAAARMRHFGMAVHEKEGGVGSGWSPAQIGLAVYPEDGSHSHELLEKARAQFSSGSGVI